MTTREEAAWLRSQLAEYDALANRATAGDQAAERRAEQKLHEIFAECSDSAEMAEAFIVAIERYQRQRWNSQ